MWRGRRIPLIVVVGFVGLFFVTCISVTPGSEWHVTDTSGKPVGNAYFVYQYAPMRPSNVTPPIRPDGVLRTDSEGVARVPCAVHFHRPFPLKQAHLNFEISLLYSPQLHVVCALRQGMVKQVGVFEPNWEEGRIVLHNQSTTPERWDQSMFWLYSLLVEGRIEGIDPATRSELISHLKDEFRQFLLVYGNTRRRIPPDIEKYMQSHPDQKHRAGIQRYYDQELLWGEFLETSWRKRLDELH